MGAWKARFSLWPIKKDPNAAFVLDSKTFNTLVNDTQYAELTEKAKAWYEANKNSVDSKQAKYWPVWQQKSEADIKARTLAPEDGK